MYLWNVTHECNGGGPPYIYKKGGQILYCLCISGIWLRLSLDSHNYSIIRPIRLSDLFKVHYKGAMGENTFWKNTLSYLPKADLKAILKELAC